MTHKAISAPLRVLLVEDSVYDRDAFRRALKKGEIAVELVLCARAEDALQRLETEALTFDLVVSDHNLPGMSGLEFCQEVIRRHLPVPTVLLTGGGSEHLAVEALKSGVNDYVLKDVEGGYLSLLPVVLPEVVRQYRERRFRQQAEEALRASEEQFRHAFEYTAVGMALMSPAGQFLRVNRAWCDIVGYSEAQLLALTMRDITHPDDLALNLESIQRVMAGAQTSFRMEKRYLHQQGHVVWGYLSATLVRNAAGEPLHFISQLQDTTTRKQMEQELRQERALLAERVRERTEELSKANAELARAVRLKDGFLAIMSHELRTPLNVVLGMSGALLEGSYGDITDRQSRAVLRIDENGRHLLSLITDILDLLEIGAGKWELERCPFAVEAMCQTCVRVLNQSIRQKHLNLSLSLDRAVTTLVADERRLKQMLVHLLSNAVKFTADGGEIGLSTKGLPDEPALAMTVWDTGIGMARDDMETLFLPFTQADSSLSRRYNGAGVGLSLVYHIVQMHGGSLLVESVVNEGSRFTATLPWRVDENSACERLDIVSGPPDRQPHALVDDHGARIDGSAMKSEGRTVMCADEHEPTLNQLSAYFARQGWRTILARHGQEMLAGMREEHPVLVILGGQLPDMPAETLIRQIRQQAPALPIAMLTALELPGDRERCLKAGAAVYRRKPVSDAVLDAMLRDLNLLAPRSADIPVGERS